MEASKINGPRNRLGKNGFHVLDLSKPIISETDRSHQITVSLVQLARQETQYRAVARSEQYVARRFGSASFRFVKKLRHTGIQRHSDAVQRVDPDIKLA